jgi:hypothetical protein
MNETTAPNAAPAEEEPLTRAGLLTRLRTTNTRRVALLEQVRRGIDRPAQDRILLELCAFRGLQYTEAAEHLGVVREAVAKRVRPLVTELGLDGLSLMQRQNAEVRRPYKRSTTATLLAQLKPDAEVSARYEAEAEDLRQLMVADMDALHASGMSWVELARQLGEGFSVPTIQRIRGTM